MNYFAHGRAYLDDPFFLAGTAVPDWLNVVDRKMKTRAKAAREHADAPEVQLRQLARGILQHHRDDAWFHQTRAFAELNLQFAVELRDRLADDAGFRPSFLGHILVEILLDATLIERFPEQLDRYYATLQQLPHDRVAQLIHRIANRTSERLEYFIGRFCDEKFLYDYSHNGKLLMRLNHVMRRVRLPRLPDSLAPWLASARHAVRQRAGELLTPPPINPPSTPDADPQSDSHP